MADPDKNFPTALSAPTLLAAHGLRPKKSLGQNFLADPSTARMLARRMSLSPEDQVVEIGAGTGALTFPLAERAGRVFAVETDRRLLPLLEDQARNWGPGNVTVMHGDFLKMSLADFPGDSPLVVAGNLPYHISSQVLVKLVRERGRVKKAALMFQKEMAARILAGPGGRDYGRISVLAAYVCSVRSLATLGPGHFFPPPKVDSVVLLFTFDRPGFSEPGEEERFFKTVGAAFSTRRKTLRNALAMGGAVPDAAAAERALAAAGIDPARRAETLDLEEFKRLSLCLGA
ncbi:MAG: ribosomal RNA small subunit methyltransferase A [Proteobacteria bacterium]|nr:ribosomal RNA small subunit methyltransferase A [Pseudomonadota bacterium]